MAQSMLMVLKSAEVVRARIKLKGQMREYMRVEGDKQIGEVQALLRDKYYSEVHGRGAGSGDGAGEVANVCNCARISPSSFCV